jgi:hypothetical protein
MGAARLVLSRMMPMGRRVSFDLPEITNFQDLARAGAALLAAVAAGEVTVQESTVIGRLLQTVAGALRAARREEERAAALLARHAARPAPQPAEKIQRNTMKPAGRAAPAPRFPAVAVGLPDPLAGLLGPAPLAARGGATAPVALRAV